MPYKDPERQKQAQHESYMRRRGAMVEKTRQERIKRRRVVHAYKLEHGCARCGYNKCASAIDAHHCGEKNFTIADAVKDGRNIDLIVAELEKCELVCANCHREEHATENV
jgi:hypothetical protein